jgi:hypothetical protein
MEVPAQTQTQLDFVQHILLINLTLTSIVFFISIFFPVAFCIYYYDKYVRLRDYQSMRRGSYVYRDLYTHQKNNQDQLQKKDLGGSCSNDEQITKKDQ